MTPEKLIKDNIKKNKYTIIILSLLSIINSVISVYIAVLAKNVLDSITGINENSIITAIISVGIFLAVQLGMNILIAMISTIVENKVILNEKRKLFFEILTSQYSKISKYRTGELINRINNDTAVVYDGVIDIIPSIASFLSQIVFAFFLLFKYDALYAIGYAVAIPFVFGVARIFKTAIKKFHKDVIASEGKILSFLQENLSNLMVVKGYCKEKFKKNSLKVLQNQFYCSIMRRTKVNIGMNVSFYMFLTIGYCFTIIWGAYRVSTGFYTMGTLVAVMELVSSIQMPLRSVSSVIPQYYQMIASGERLLEIKSMDRDNKNETDTKHFEKNFKEMRIENLCFDYEEQKVFENLNVRIAKGERLLISGESGIGKSTLVKLLLGYEIPRKGSIALICGDRQFFAGKDTRNLISFMPQGNMLFSGSIKDNILFGEEEDKEKLSKALELACVDFTDSLPMGLETHLGENGLGLSQGQGQRISLARTLYSDREVLLLDEPTSALDSQTQEKILNNLKGIGKTIIIISHKKETEGFADKILRM